MDATWSVHNGKFTFHIDGDQIAVWERGDGFKTEHRTHDATMSFSDGQCRLHSDLLSVDSVVRIWKGYVWRDAIHRYYLQDENDTYHINRRYSRYDGIYPPFGVVWYRDFLDLNNRNDPRPHDLHEIRKSSVRAYYLPINFSQAALDTLDSIPKDDRPFLESPFSSCEGCMEEPAIEPSESDEPSRPGGSVGGGGFSSGGGGGSSSGGSVGGGGSGGGGGGSGGSGGVGDSPSEGDEDSSPGDGVDEEDSSSGDDSGLFIENSGSGGVAGSTGFVSFRVARDGKRVAGQTVSFSKIDINPNATLNNSSDVSDEEGYVYARISLGKKATGTCTIEASVGSSKARGSFTITVPSNPSPPPPPLHWPSGCAWPPSSFPWRITKIIGASATHNRAREVVAEWFSRDGTCSRQECGTTGLPCTGSDDRDAVPESCISIIREQGFGTPPNCN